MPALNEQEKPLSISLPAAAFGSTLKTALDSP
jgi:hypothetical protein